MERVSVMENLPHALSFRELLVYQKARKLAQDVFEQSKLFPKEETYALTDQIRRSSRSIGAQIAEAWAKRRYERSFVSKLTDADGEQQETQHWIGIVFDCGYLTEQIARQFRSDAQEIGRLLAGMIAKSESFCSGGGGNLKELSPEYLVADQK
jgi:four helix bundle protein